MGLFDRVLGKKEDGPLSFTQREALAAISVLAVAADGVVEEEELRRIVTGLAEKKAFRGQTLDDLGRLLNNSAKLVQRRGPAPVMEAIKKALSSEMRETAFAMATYLVLADGDVDPKEKAFLEDFQKALEINGDQAIKIAEVMVIENRG